MGASNRGWAIVGYAVRDVRRRLQDLSRPGCNGVEGGLHEYQWAFIGEGIVSIGLCKRCRYCIVVAALQTSRETSPGMGGTEFRQWGVREIEIGYVADPSN